MTPPLDLKNNNPSSSRSTGMGAVLSWQRTPFGIHGKTNLAKFSVTLFRPGMIRIQATKGDSFDPNPYSVILKNELDTFEIESTPNKIILITKKLIVEINLTNFGLKFMDLRRRILLADDALGIAWIGTEVTNYKQVQPNERFLGLGEKTGNLDRKGKSFTNWNTDYFAYGVGDDPLYMSIPFYIGTHAVGSYGIFLDNTHKTVFNFGASTNRFTSFGAEDGDMDYYFIHEPSISQIISSYTDLTGKMAMPPKWALGFQQCRYSYYPEKEVLTVANTFREKNMPADVIYLDIHHMESYKVFTFDGIKFPDAKSMISKLKKLGFKVIVILDPGIKTEDNYIPYKEGKVQELFVKYPDGVQYEAEVWPGWCVFPDFTNPKTRVWWAQKMVFYTEAGVDGFWTDMNEPASWGQCTPNLIEFDFEGEVSSHRKARNIYGMQMARATMEGAKLQQKERRPFVLTRAGFAGIQRYAAVWTGDNVASDEHMLSGIRLINSLGMSGVAFAGYDVGGFAGEPTQALFARWISIATFSPLFRAHTMINTRDSEPWAFGEEVEEIARNYMKLRYRLMPTIYSSFYKSSKSGLPIASSLAIDYPLDDTIYQATFQNQYIFCDVFLIAPIESYKEISKIYLPEGGWYNLFTDQFYEGKSTIYQDTPLSYLPVFVKSSAIFAMQSDVPYTEATHDGILRIHLYVGTEPASYTHFEDDGTSLDYQIDKYFKRIISYAPEKQMLSFSEAEGLFQSDYHKIRVYLHGFQSNSVLINDASSDIQSETYAFLSRLTEFDPLPEHEHPYFSIPNLRYFEVEHLKKSISIRLID